MLKSSLCDYNNVYILLNGNIKVIGQGADAEAIATNKNNKQVKCKDCALITDSNMQGILQCSSLSKKSKNHSSLTRNCQSTVNGFDQFYLVFHIGININ